MVVRSSLTSAIRKCKMTKEAQEFMIPEKKSVKTNNYKQLENTNKDQQKKKWGMNKRKSNLT
jgi:bisphosphoglycerate-dependent phosphoglycerate mutase